MPGCRHIRTLPFIKTAGISLRNNNITYLDPRISENQISPISDNMKAVKEFPIPKNLDSSTIFLKSMLLSQVY